MATKRSLIQQLALARAKKKPKSPLERTVSPSKAMKAPEPREEQPQTEVISNPEREIAKKCAEQAFICGWDKSIQIHAYENNISEDRMRQILDEALAYNDKADPSGRIEELQDWEQQKMGRSNLAGNSHRPSG